MYLNIMKKKKPLVGIITITDIIYTKTQFS